jgi:hypothetical protein
MHRGHAVRSIPTEQEVSVSPPGPSDTLSYATHIKPLFREGDRSAMKPAFDLWSYDDVSKHSAAILARLEEGTMPCDGAWPAERVEIFRSWLEQGTPG